MDDRINSGLGEMLSEAKAGSMRLTVAYGLADDGQWYVDYLCNMKVERRFGPFASEQEAIEAAKKIQATVRAVVREHGITAIESTGPAS